MCAVETKTATTGNSNTYSHPYASPGDYEVKIKYFTPDGVEVGTGHLSISVPLGNCWEREPGFKTHTWAYRAAGNRAIRGSAGVYLDGSKMATFATTEAFHWENGLGGWKWRTYKHAVRLKAEYTVFRQKKEGYRCIPDGTDGAATWPWGATEANVRQTGPSFGWSVFYSHHEMICPDGLGDVYLNLTIYPCDRVGPIP